MGKITALNAQARNPERVNVYIDGEFAFGLAYVAAAKLRIDQELSQPEIDALQRQDTFEKAKDSAYRLISLRPRSIAEIQQSLNRKGYDTEVIFQVIVALSELELLDDKAFAKFWVEQRDTFKPRSHMALRQELQQKGISRNLIDEVLAVSDETNAAKMAAEKKTRQLSHLSEADFKKKLGQFLQRRGFNYDVAKEIVAEMWRQSAEVHLAENETSGNELSDELSD